MTVLLEWRTLDQADPAGIRLPVRRAVKAPKNVFALGRKYKTLPSNFRLFRCHNPLVRKFRNIRQLPERTELPPPFEAVRVTGSSARSDTYLLPSPGLRIRERLEFEDDQGNHTGQLYVSSFGGISGVTVLGTGLEGEYVSAADPTVRFTVLVPWGTGPNNLRAHAQAVADELTQQSQEEEAGLGKAFMDFCGQYLDEAARGWKFDITPEVADVGENESVRFQVTVGNPEPSATALAIRVTDTQNPEAYVISDIIVVERTRAGELSLLFGTD